MKNQAEKFLEFNGKEMYFTFVDGQWWVAVKPVCEALKVNFERQRQNLKNDEILNQLPTEQQVVAADGKFRKMTCLPERYVYGWLFSIRSSSPQLLEYKKKCYDILFDYFNGTIVRRKKVLSDRSLLQEKIRRVEEELSGIQVFLDWKEYKKDQKQKDTALKRMDQELLDGQLDLFQN